MFQGLLCALISPATGCLAGNYTHFDVAVYIPVGAVRSFENLRTLSNNWRRISSQLKVDKVYIEVQRNRELAGDDLLERVKQFFLDRGVRVAGGMALSDGGSGQFRSFCYTDPQDREFVKKPPNWPPGILTRSFRTIFSLSPPNMIPTSRPRGKKAGPNSGWT